ncbi:MAG: hypothetical protein QXH20_05220 [Candidatus Bathyarchaeia archaeon]
MPRQRLGEKVGVSLHLWVPRDVAEAAKRLCVVRGTSLSVVVAEFLEKWVNETADKAEGTRDYELLKREYQRLSYEFERLRDQMREVDPEGELQNLAIEYGLDPENMTNMEEVVAKLLTTYNGSTQKLHLFIDYLEAYKRLIEKEEQITNIRYQKYLTTKNNKKQNNSAFFIVDKNLKV